MGSITKYRLYSIDCFYFYIIICFQDCTGDSHDGTEPSDVPSAARAASPTPIHAVNTSVITGAESLADKDKHESHVLERQISVIQYLCAGIAANTDELLIDAVSSQSEFMSSLTFIAASYKLYSSLQSRSVLREKGCKLDVVLTEVNMQLEKLKTGLEKLACVIVVSTNLTVQLKSVQEKLNRVLALLPVLFATKDALK